MKIIVYTLTLALTIFTYDLCPAETENNPVEITTKQELVSEIVSEMKGINEIKWINIYTIQATLDTDYFYYLNEAEIKQQAEEDVNLIVTHGYKITDKLICAKILDQNGKELAYKCEGNTPS